MEIEVQTDRGLRRVIIDNYRDGRAILDAIERDLEPEPGAEAGARPSRAVVWAGTPGNPLLFTLCWERGTGWRIWSAADSWRSAAPSDQRERGTPQAKGAS